MPGFGAKKGTGIKMNTAGRPFNNLFRPDGQLTSPWQKNLGRSSLPLSFPRQRSWWTGPVPKENEKVHSLWQPNLTACTKEIVQAYFDNTWLLTEILFSSLLNEEAFYCPPHHNLRYPLIFYYAHPAVLYVNTFLKAGLINNPVNEYYEDLFAQGVDEMSFDDMSKNDNLWPTLNEVHLYRREVYRLVSRIIEESFSDKVHPPIQQNHALWGLFLAFEHERIHFETSSVIIRELPPHLVRRPHWFPDLHISSKKQSSGFPSNPFIYVESSPVEIGKPRYFPTFGWDNEYGLRKAKPESFLTTRYLISNGEFFEFVESGAYTNEKHWSEIGWKWRSMRDTQHPYFWIRMDGGFKLRTCFEIINMPWSWPVIVNYYEAKAFCSWRQEKDASTITYRLMTEAEHHILRDKQLRATSKSKHFRYNNNLICGSESPVDNNSNKSVIGDLFGNLWQWMEDTFNPLDADENGVGFSPHPFYDDFSTPCFDGKHQMIMGGSFISTGDEAEPYARFHFRPHFFQHAGFRLVRSNTDGSVKRL